MFRRRFSIGAALVLFVGGGCVYTPGRFTQVPTGPARGLTFDQELTAALGPTDHALRGQLPFQTWAFDGGAGETITLEVHGCGMNPLLTLLDAGGKELARDEDRDTGRGARIEYTLPSEQRYYVVATRTVTASRSVVTPYTLYAARSGSTASAPADLAAPPPLPPTGAATNGLIVTGLQDVGRRPGLPPERHVFGVDEAPVFFALGGTGWISVTEISSGVRVFRPVFGRRSGVWRRLPVIGVPGQAMAGYYLSASLTPGTYCVEAPPEIPVASAIFRIGDATQPPELDSTRTAIYSSVAAAEGNAYAPALTRYRTDQRVMLVARLGAQRREAVATVLVTEAATHAPVYAPPASPLQPARPGFFQVGSLPRGRYAVRLTVADTVAARWDFAVE